MSQNQKHFFDIFVESLQSIFGLEDEQKLKETIKEIPQKNIKKESFPFKKCPSLSKNDNFEIVKPLKRSGTTGTHDVYFQWNNLSYFSPLRFKNPQSIKVKRIAEGCKTSHGEIFKDEIYTIRNVDNGQISNGWIYLKELGDFNGEWNPRAFEFQTDLHVVLLKENQNDKYANSRLCLVDKFNNILMEEDIPNYDIDYTRRVENAADYLYSMAKQLLRYENEYDYSFLAFSETSQNKVDKLLEKREYFNKYYEELKNDSFEMDM